MTKKVTSQSDPLQKRVTFYRNYHDVERNTYYKNGSTYRARPALAQAVVGDGDCAVFEGSPVPVAAELDELRRQAKVAAEKELRAAKHRKAIRDENARVAKIHAANKAAPKPKAGV